jgi:hypothetical protein
VVVNDSRDTVKVQVQLTGSGFEEAPTRGGSWGVFKTEGKPCVERIRDRACESLAPRHGCDIEIDFSPEQSGTSRGHLEVLVTGSVAPVSKTYELAATGKYPPELQAIDVVIQHHRPELMRIPHAVRVSIGEFDDNVIQVEVAHEEDIAKVERSTPPTLEGYRVEVIEQIQRGWGY